MTSATPTVLVVCAANICRSVLGETLIQNSLRSGIAVIRSAGIPGIHGASMCPVARDHLLCRDPSAVKIADQHRSKRLETLDATEANIILTASRQERDSVVRLAPAAREKTFTMREAVALTRVVSRAGMSPTPFDAVVDRLTQARGLGLPLPTVTGRRLFQSSPNWRDIPDAHVGKQVRHRHTMKAVAEAAEELAAFLSNAVEATQIVDPRNGRHRLTHSRNPTFGQLQDSSSWGTRFSA